MFYYIHLTLIISWRKFFSLLLVLNYLDVDPYRQPVLTNEVNGTMFYFLHINLLMVSLAKFIKPETGASIWEQFSNSNKGRHKIYSHFSPSSSFLPVDRLIFPPRSFAYSSFTQRRNSKQNLHIHKERDEGGNEMIITKCKRWSTKHSEATRQFMRNVPSVGI